MTGFPSCIQVRVVSKTATQRQCNNPPSNLQTINNQPLCCLYVNVTQTMYRFAIINVLSKCDTAFNTQHKNNRLKTVTITHNQNGYRTALEIRLPSALYDSCCHLKHKHTTLRSFIAFRDIDVKTFRLKFKKR